MNYERVLGQVPPASHSLRHFGGARVREVTEGRIAHVAKVGDQIDYSAGKSAKELLMAKLEPR